MSTLLQHIGERVRACGMAADGVQRPAAILWTDPQRQFVPAVAVLRQHLPELVELGSFQPGERRGPAIWVRCVVDGALPPPPEAGERVPIVYLPGIARQQLRAGEDCAEELRPLVDLLYRGHAWVQQGGHDHTLSAFLKSPSHLGLDVAEDGATQHALVNAVRDVLCAPVEALRGRRLEAADFNKLVAGDVVRDLLRWIGDPTAARQAMAPERWQAFLHSVKSEWKISLEADGALTAAERLCKAQGPWAQVWARFGEAPDSYPGLVAQLARVEPPAGDLLARVDYGRYVQANDRAEGDLREALAGLVQRSRAEACTEIARLEAQHGVRREHVWARLGRAPWALALEPLARLARGVQVAVGGVTPEDVRRAYERAGWTTDLALLDVLAHMDGTRDAVLKPLVRHLALDWLDDGARALQRAMAAQPVPGQGGSAAITPCEGCCVVFVDGLRYDVGQRLADRLEEAGCRVRRASRWAALPTVTATGKPAVCPVAGEIEGRALEGSFAPVFRRSGRPVDAAGLREAVVAGGGQLVGTEHLPMAIPGKAGGWSEHGDIDTLGHQRDAGLARLLDDELRRLVEAVQGLLRGGWRSVRIVTDHGWLLLPGGLPRIDLPRALAETKWARCALLQGAAPDGIVRIPWHWNAQHAVATPPGVGCFRAGVEYVHGGVSVQECLTPDLLVEAPGGEGGAQPTLASVAWVKHRCVIEARHAPAGARIDIRVGVPHGPSAVRAARPLDAEGGVSIPVEDEYEAKDLVVVLLDAAGTVIAQRTTRIGGTT